MTNNLLLFTLVVLSLSPLSKLFSQIEIKASSPVQVNDQNLEPDKNGIYVYQLKSTFPTILNLKQQDQEWEIYAAPDKLVAIEIKEDDLLFNGDLIAENKHLFSEKKLNDSINVYLNKNWYQLHKSEESTYLRIIDSLKNIFLNHMEGNTKLSATFKALNRASVNYAFDRLILRYPELHGYFTGTNIELSKKAIQSIKSDLDKPEYAELASYKKYTQKWLELEIQKMAAQNTDTSIYRALVKTKIALDLTSSVFKNQELVDYWSFEFVKAHIDQCTWINGKQFLEVVEANCKTPKIKTQIKEYKEAILKERSELETIIYKTEKGFQLEAYIFRPKAFDASKTYATLAAFHGGGWIVGDAGFTISSAKHAAENGLIGFSVEYRLSNRDDITPAEAMQDVRDFIKWLRQNATNLSINPNQIIAKGLSAGGHLVSAISVLQKAPESVPNAVILVSPALDTRDGYFKSLVKKGVNSSTLSPLENLSANMKMPRTLLLQGRTDNLTPTKYAEEFDAKMKAFNYDCELVIYENCGHLFTPSHLDDTGWPQSDPEISKKAFERQAAFYKQLGYAEE